MAITILQLRYNDISIRYNVILSAMSILEIYNFSNIVVIYSVVNSIILLFTKRFDD
jgi:hypothetical protein